MRAAASRTFCTAGRSNPIKIAIIAITTNNSISVNARWDEARGMKHLRCAQWGADHREERRKEWGGGGLTTRTCQQIMGGAKEGKLGLLIATVRPSLLHQVPAIPRSCNENVSCEIQKSLPRRLTGGHSTIAVRNSLGVETRRGERREVAQECLDLTLESREIDHRGVAEADAGI